MSRMSPPSSSSREQIASQIAQVLTRLGLRQPAVIFLNAGRPLVFLMGQLFYVAQPALSLFWPYERLTHIGQFLEDPEALPQLLNQLETE